MKKFIQSLKNKRKKSYQADFDTLISQFNQENETIKGYNGRQVLELLQNCDDEKASKVLIELDRKEQKLKISNTGYPFSEEGYRSLSLSNLSSKKDKKIYIGNKGLGFRSIINWSEEIQIISNNICLTYSDNIREKEFKQMFNDIERERIINQAKCEIGKVPVPFLALPNISICKQDSDYTTTIIIKFKIEFYDDIIKQLKETNEKTLLFLNNINEIQIYSITENTKEILKRERKNIDSDVPFAPSEEVTIANKTWQIFEDEGCLSGNEEFYQIKLAVSDSKEPRGVIYNYFKTNVEINLPYVIHATFDLDSTRNQFVKSSKNEEVVKKLVQLIANTAIYFTKSEEKVSWKPLSLLTLKEHDVAKSLKDLSFWQEIQKIINKEALFPCIDNTYRRINEVFFIDDCFVSMLLRNKGEKIFKDFLIAKNNFPITERGIPSNIQERVNSLSQQIKDNGLRTDFIFEVNKHFPQDAFNFLTDENNNLINSDKTVFTPPQEEVSIPEFVTIKIINKDLYEKLCNKFGDKVVGALEKNCKIKKYDSKLLQEEVIKSTKVKCEEGIDCAFFIREMVKFLFNNYKILKKTDNEQPSWRSESRGNKEKTDVITIPDIPLLNLNGKVKYAQDLYLSKKYKSGKIASKIFSAIYHDDELLAEPSLFTLEDTEEAKVEDFFLWLGVNKFVKWKKGEVKWHRDWGKYNNLTIHNFFKKVIEETKHSYTNYTVKYNNIEKIDIILTTLDIYKLILWVKNDSMLENQLKESQIDDNIQLTYGNWSSHNIRKSFIKYQILEEVKFNYNKYLISDEYNELNEESIEYNDTLLNKHGIKKPFVNEVLILLGAKKNLEDLPKDRVFEILNKLPVIYPKGDKVEGIYKRLFKNKKQADELPKKITLFGRIGNIKRAYNSNEIYYGDIRNIPQKLQKKYPILLFPCSFSYKEEEVATFFGTKKIKDIRINIKKYELNEQLNKKFKTHFDSLKPCILAKVSNDQDFENEKHEVRNRTKNQDYKSKGNQLNEINFYICNYIESVVGSDECVLGHNEFIREKNNYYIATKTSVTNIDTFSDVFGKIISSHFNLDNSDTLSRFFSDGEQKTRKRVITEVGEDTFRIVNEFFGKADIKKVFWQRIFELKNERFSFDDKKDYLNQYIEKTLNIDIEKVESLNFENFDDIDNTKILKHIFEQLKINIGNFNAKSDIKVSMSMLHKETIENYFNKKENDVKYCIWKSFNAKTRNEQEKFRDALSRYNHRKVWIDEEAQKISEKITIDCDALFDKFMSEKFNDIIIEEDETKNIQQIRKENERDFSLEQKEKIGSDAILSSLIYFSKNIDFIKNKLQNIIANEKENNNSDDYREVPKIVVDIKNYVTKDSPHKQEKTPNAVYTPKTPNDQERKRQGNKAEEIVYNYLVKKYGENNVVWKSREDEGRHYDIHYFLDKEREQIRYVEVKSFNTNSFRLTAAEKKFGEDNQSKYEIWLVPSDPTKEIKKIEDFFQRDDIKFNPTEYKVILEYE